MRVRREIHTLLKKVPPLLLAASHALRVTKNEQMVQGWPRLLPLSEIHTNIQVLQSKVQRHLASLGKADEETLSTLLRIATLIKLSHYERGESDQLLLEAMEAADAAWDLISHFPVRE